MKSLIFLALTMALSTVALAVAPDKAKLERCTGIGSIAGTIMKSRQNGASMAKLMAVETISKEFKDVMAEMIKDAFSTSIYSSDSYKQQAIQEFENKWFGLCIS